MTLATLIEMGDDPSFAFEHAMSHRLFFAVMSPLTRFSILPYILDPMEDTNIPASYWHVDHQQAHDDLNRALPSFYSSGGKTGIPNGHILSDTDLSVPERLSWWEFKNLVEHQIATSAIEPYVYGKSGPEWTYPFW